MAIGTPAARPSLCRPFGAQRSRRLGCVVGLFIKPVAQVGETGIERVQELLVRQTAPLVRVERLVAGGADPSFDQPRIDDAGENGRRPVGQLDPGIGGVECLRRDVQAMPDLGPEPLGRIDAAALGDVSRTKLRAEFGDPGGLGPARMILPEPALGRKIGLPSLVERQGPVCRVDRNGTRSGRIEPNSDHFGGTEITLARGLGERRPDACLKPEEIVAGMLPGEKAVFRVEQDALSPRRIVDDAAAVFRAVGCAHDERAHRVGAEIDA